MKANELRVGNLIDCGALGLSDRIGTVHEILADSITIYANNDFHSILWDDVGEIPLNEEWLTRFGFVPFNIGHGQWVDKGAENRIDTREERNVCFYFRAYKNQEEHDLWILMNDFQYVHELQNLYFALTGEELSITEQQSS